MPDPVLKPTSGTMPEPTADPWHITFEEFKTRDEKMVKDYQEDIDTLLVFAGLFSAVLTAFVVESYQSLQEDLAQTSVDLLRHISSQLANSSLPAAPIPSQFQAQRSDVRVNVCWFVSLLLSLVVALFGIFLKQWMRAYMKWTDVTPERQAVAIRQFRYRSLEKWHIWAILTLLPTLLQLSVILFLSGLLVFLSSLDQTVAIIMTVLTSIAFFLVAAVTALPVVTWTCPYRSPLSEVLTLSLWRTTGYANIVGSAFRIVVQPGWRHAQNTSRWEALASRWRTRSKTTLPTSWAEADEGAIDRHNSEDRVSMHLSAIVHLCCTTQSRPLWSAAITAITASSSSDSVTVAPRASDPFYKDVWSPVFKHITLFNEKEYHPQLGYNGSMQLYHRTSSQFTHFSSSMKHCWVNFLMKFKSLACQSKSSCVVESFLLCCIASMESTIGGPCGLALMQVLKARHRMLEKPWLDSIALSLSIHVNTGAIFTMWDSKSGTRFIQDVRNLCSQLNDIPKTTQTGKYRQLLDILTQLACQAALATVPEPWVHVPDNLKNPLRALQPVYDHSPPYPSSVIARSCMPAMILVAGKEPDLFPKPLARALVRQVELGRLKGVVQGVPGLDLEGVDVDRLKSKWETLDDRSLAAIERLIKPEPFARILKAYGEPSFEIDNAWSQLMAHMGQFAKGVIDG